MKERLITFCFAIGALVSFYLLFLPKPAAGPPQAARPLSSGLRPTGYQAAWRWLVATHIPVTALHAKFGQLSCDDGKGSILLTTLPHKVPISTDEAMQLDAWIGCGNTLLVAAALDDTPFWALSGANRLVEDVGRLTRLKFETADADSRKAGLPPEHPLDSVLSALGEQPRIISIEARGTHPLMNGVDSIRVESALPAARWCATSMDSAAVLEIGQVTPGHTAAIWLRRQGRGQVIAIAVAGLFSNQDIGSSDNARLLSNIVAWSLLPGGSMIFDDAHQGAMGVYDGKAFFADPRLHRTIGWLVLLWFVFVLGIQRLRVHVADWRPADITAFIRTSGDFFASTLTPAAAAARMLANFFNSIHRRLGTGEDGTPEWAWLSSQATVQAEEVSDLRELYAQVEIGRRVDLVRLQNLLSRLQGRIT